MQAGLPNMLTRRRCGCAAPFGCNSEGGLMADYSTIRATTAGAQAARIDEGLRAHMNKVYGTMSVGLLVTFAVAWAVGSSPALLSVFRDPLTLQPNILGWVAM